MEMNVDDRIQALQTLGYTEREAQFLCLAALHSGSFVMRQYLDFRGAKRGKVSDDFAARAVAERHLTMYRTRNKTLVYQITKPVFVALGDPDNRNRRIKQTLLTRLRLMALDFVLLYPEHRYLATEVEKVAYFSEELRLPAGTYPARVYHSRQASAGTTTRYFIEKYPIFRSGAGAGFAYLDENSLTSFGSFLDRYQPLLSALPESQVVYVSTSARILEAARACFQQRWKCPARTIDYVELEAEFRERRNLEEKPLADLNQRELTNLRMLRKSRFAHLYEAWQAQGVGSLRARFEPENGHGTPKFMACILPAEYTFL
jgi:hypothetical protein